MLKTAPTKLFNPMRKGVIQYLKASIVFDLQQTFEAFHARRINRQPIFHETHVQRSGYRMHLAIG